MIREPGQKESPGCVGDRDDSDQSSRGQPRNHAPFVGKPFDQSRHWDDITKTQTKAAQDPKTQIEQSEVSARLPGQYHSQPITKTGDHCYSPRACAFHPNPARESGDPKHEYRQFECKSYL